MQKWCRFYAGLNPYFTGLSILIRSVNDYVWRTQRSLNPYFTGLSILIINSLLRRIIIGQLSQSLFYWIIYSYGFAKSYNAIVRLAMSQSLFYWIIYSYLELIWHFQKYSCCCLNPYFTGLSILIIPLYFFGPRALELKAGGLNPYFTGLSILILVLISLAASSGLVSILILLDYLFLWEVPVITKHSLTVSILILLDYLFL